VAREDDDFFLARWSRRKAQVQRGVVVEPEPPAAEPAVAPVVAPVVAPAAEAAARPPATDARAAPARQLSRSATPPAAPTLEDVAKLTRDADFSRFVARDVAAPVRHAALKKLFSDPHFNVMDGLDIYIDDYGRADPLPASMLRQLVQARGLGLFREETPATPASAVADSGAAPPDADRAPAPPHDSESDPAPDAGPTTAGLALADDPAGQPHSADAAAPYLPPDEDPDLQLQPHDAAGPDGDRRRAGQDPRRLD
jgi:hypothetical protein